jgi:hypothetical protein
MTWTRPLPEPEVEPHVRSSALAYDSARDRVVLFGADYLGRGPKSPEPLPPAETWEYDGTVWAETTPVTSPPSVLDSRMVYDSARARVVLFGGQGWSTGLYDETWEYIGP